MKSYSLPGSTNHKRKRSRNGTHRLPVRSIKAPYRSQPAVRELALKIGRAQTFIRAQPQEGGTVAHAGEGYVGGPLIIAPAYPEINAQKLETSISSRARDGESLQKCERLEGWLNKVPTPILFHSQIAKIHGNLPAKSPSLHQCGISFCPAQIVEIAVITDHFCSSKFLNLHHFSAYTVTVWQAFCASVLNLSLSMLWWWCDVFVQCFKFFICRFITRNCF